MLSVRHGIVTYFYKMYQKIKITKKRTKENNKKRTKKKKKKEITVKVYISDVQAYKADVGQHIYYLESAQSIVSCTKF